MYLGKILSVHSAAKGTKSACRPEVAALELIKDYGIKGDKFAGKNCNRVVMIVGDYSYRRAKKEGITLERGALGENILFDFNPHTLPLGAQLRIDDAMIEITEHCSICSHLSVFDPSLPELVHDCRGLYCKIIKEGTIKAGMEVTKHA